MFLSSLRFLLFPFLVFLSPDPDVTDDMRTTTHKTFRPAWTATVPALLVLLAVLANPGSIGSEEPEGHWDDLGEDGRIWVPAEPPEATALPDEDLGDYHNYTEIVDAIHLIEQERPELFHVDQIGTSVQGRAIYKVTVQAPVGAAETDDRVRVLFDGAHHGNEVIGSEILVRLLLEIHEEYDTDPEMQAILDEVVVDVVPVVNTDGMSNTAFCSHYADCRKNANGVDLNRNYDAHWGGSGSSGSPGSPTYRGPDPFSEPETQALAALLDAHDYAHHLSMHSGTKLVLWPLGWTTERPQELSLFEDLGQQLSDLSGAAHGQASRILYVADGTTMDYAYEEAHGWHPPSFTPEVYGGSGGAFDWWTYFNPQEVDSVIQGVVDPWLDAIWHLVYEAPDYAPVRLVAPEGLSIGPDAGELEVEVTISPKRPLLGGSLLLDTGDAPVNVVSGNPVDLSQGSGTQTVSFTLLAERGGEFTVDLVLDAGPAGSFVRPIDLALEQVELDLELASGEMESPQVNTASLHVATGPFDAVTGTVQFTLEPSGTSVGSGSFSASGAGTDLLEMPFDALSLGAGEHRMVATADFIVTKDGVDQEGFVLIEEDLFVHRPQLEVERWHPSTGQVGEPFQVVSIHRNTGTVDAVDVTVEKRIPQGFIYWMRDGPLPLPQDPLGSPEPDSIVLNADGTMNVTWSLGTIPADGLKSIRYGVMPYVPGEGLLVSHWSYGGDFSEGAALFTGQKESVLKAE